MEKSPQQPNELDRLKALESYSIMDTLPEKEYDAITELASLICGTPISLISLVDQERQWFKSSVGLGVDQTSRDFSFCQYTIMGDDVYEVTNALENELFANNPLVTGNPNIRFYAGAPLKDSNGFNLGSLCVIGTEPKKLSDNQIKCLKLLASQVSVLLDLRKKNDKLLNAEKEITNFIELSKDLVCIANVNGMFYQVNPAFTTVLGYLKEELEGTAFTNFVHPDDLDKTYKEVEKLASGAKTISFENRYRKKNGEYVVLSWNASPDPLTGNLYCIARDITSEKQIQEVLYKTSADLEAILESAEFSVIATGIDGIVTHFNRGSETLLGYKAAEIIGKTSPESFHVKDEVLKYTEELSIELGKKVEPTFADFVIKSCESGYSSSREWTYNRKNGSCFTMLLSLTSVKNIYGDITGYLGIGKDVTKQKEVELSLLNSNKLLDESESIAKIGSWKFDAIGRELIWSKGQYDIFELEELPSKQLFKAYKSRLHPDDSSRLDEMLTNTLTLGVELSYKHRVLLPDSKIKHVIGIGQAYKNQKGEIIGIQGFNQDITEKTLAEEIIAEKSKEINDVRSALEQAAIVTIADQKGVVTFVNDNFCSISKYSQEELIGQSYNVGNPNIQLNKFVMKIWKTIADGKVWKGHLKNIAKDGSFYWMDSTIVPFLDNEGKPYQYIAISFNITAQKLAQDNLNTVLVDLEKKNIELDQFGYIVSHDLKAPLRAIYNLSEWIIEDMPTLPETVADNFRLLQGRVQRMENLINGVLDYSRIGKIKIERESVDIKVMLEQVAETLVPKKDFEISIIGNFPVIRGAKILLSQVFSNLISNAVKYNDKPIGKVECIYESITGFHQFSIKDNGIGIAEVYHKKVFQVFQTIDARDKNESTGIGLAIVLKIIEELGGSIKIESEESKGATFIFTIPI